MNMYIYNLTKISKHFTIITTIICITQILFSCKKENYVKYTTTFISNPPLITTVTNLSNRNQNLSSATYGDWIIIKGTNLGTTNKVEFSTIAVNDSLVYADDTTITVKIPTDLPNPENNPITVTTIYGKVVYNFKILQPLPLITSFSPRIGATDTEVTINGNYFLGTTSVKLNNTAVSIVSISKTEIKVKIPASINAGYFYVTTPSGTIKATISYGLSYIIYDDTLANGWTNTSYSATSLFSNQSNTARGANSIKINYTAGFGGFRLNKIPSINLSNYTAIKFSVFGGNNSDGFKIRLIVNASSITTYTYTITAGLWNYIEVPLSSLNNPTTLSSIELKEYSGKTFEILLDDLGLL